MKQAARTVGRMRAKLCLAPLAGLLAGCGGPHSSGLLEMVSLGSTPLRLETPLSHGCYAVREADDSFWFSTVPLEALLAHDQGAPLTDAMFVHAQLVWLPEAGKTPVNPAATNLVVRVVVVSGGEVGLYGGAAFASQSGEIGAETVALEVEGGSLTLLGRTDGFHDLLSPAGLTASLAAAPDPTNANRWRRAVSQFVTNTFGRSMWVRGEPRRSIEGAVANAELR